jgi:hypothetical protein
MADHEQQAGPGGWLPPVPPGQPPPPQQAWGAPAPWPSTLYYSYREPGNDAAVAGFGLAVGALVSLIISAGLFFFIALPVAIAGTLVARRGLRRVTSGETRQHGSLARIGFWIGLAAIIGSIGAGTGWILAAVNGHVFDKSPPSRDRLTPALVRPR